MNEREGIPVLSFIWQAIGDPLRLSFVELALQNNIRLSILPMPQHPQSFIIAPNMMILRGQKILLLQRADWAPLWPGHWHCPTGKIEEGESPRQTAIRESYEEVGLRVNPYLGIVVTVKAKSFQDPNLIYKDLSLFFVAEFFDGEPFNKEVRLHKAMGWFDIDCLPTPIIPVVKFGIEHYIKGENYAEFRTDC